MKPLEILISNDDGWQAKGLEVLIRALRPMGNLTAVAPEVPQSGQSGSISLGVEKMRRRLRRQEPGVALWSFEGTPVDCVKMGIRLLEETGRRPDLVVSGINHGSNVSAATFYSGTVGAALEGAVHGFPALAFSLNSHDPDADFRLAEPWIAPIARQLAEHPPGSGIMVNVNFPAATAGPLRGIRFGRQGAGKWFREYEEYRDSQGLFYRMYGEFCDLEGTHGTDTALPADHRLVREGYVSIVPHRVDTTDYDEILRLAREWRF